MTNTWLARHRRCFSSGTMIFTLITAIGAISSPFTALAQNKKNVIIFDLVANPQFANCLRRSQFEEPRARATVIRGKLNDTLFLDLDDIKSGLQFDLFTVQRSSLLDASTPNPAFKGSFGLAWYQSDIEIPKGHDRMAMFGSRPSCSIRSSVSIRIRHSNPPIPSTWDFGSTIRRMRQLVASQPTILRSSLLLMESTRLVLWP